MAYIVKVGMDVTVGLGGEPIPLGAYARPFPHQFSRYRCRRGLSSPPISLFTAWPLLCLSMLVRLGGLRQPDGTAQG